MARSLSSSTMQSLAAAFTQLGWNVELTPAAGAVEAWKSSRLATDHIVSFSRIYNKRDAVCYQAGVGIRLSDVNRVLDELRGVASSGRNFTAYVLIGHLAPERARRPGWCFSPAPEVELAAAAQQMAQEILAIPEVQSLFASIVDVPSYIEAIEAARWPFVSIIEQYIAALISVGRIADAVAVAERGEREYLAVVAERGRAPRDADLVVYRKAKMLRQ